MSREEKTIFKETDQEFKRKGGFTRIFPCSDFLYYKQFFEEERPWNYLIDAKLFHKQRPANNFMAMNILHKAPGFMNSTNQTFQEI